jgi:beta-lactamase class A
LGYSSSLDMYGRERRAHGNIRRSRVPRGPASRVPARDRRRAPRRGPWVLLALVLLCVVFAGIFLRGGEGQEETAKVAAVDGPATAQSPEPPADPARARALGELDERLEGISRAHAGAHGAVVFDPLSGETASLNADRRFVAASLSKLYALLTLYSAASRGEVDLDDEITMRASDVWAEGTGVLYAQPVGTTMTLRECATILIKESDNTAEVMLNRYLGEEKIEAELRRVGARSTSYWVPNTTTPNDVLLVLKAISDPSHTSPELSAEMLDIMTGTSFEDRLPGPLPEGTRVAHKIGSWETTFSDAGIVLPEGASGAEEGYYVVAFSEGAMEGEARETIRDVSLEAYRALAPPGAR